MQGKPSSAIITYQRALTLNPSPEQRIRIRLTLGENFCAEPRSRRPGKIQNNFLRNLRLPRQSIRRSKVNCARTKTRRDQRSGQAVAFSNDKNIGHSTSNFK